jgi:Na+/H+-dicarboxylate symporter
MTKAQKPIIGYAMAAMLAVQVILLPLFLTESTPARTALYVSYSAQNTLVNDHAEKSPIIYESERLVISIPKSFAEDGNLIYSTLAAYFIHINQRLTTAYQISQQVKLVFGIREIKFPTHFFW